MFAIAPYPWFSSLPILIWTGATLQNCLANAWISFGHVALNIRVCLSGVVILYTICLISFSKPISSILSASSNTRYVHLLRFVSPVLRKSRSLPGVAIRISTPYLSFYFYSYLGTPPYTHKDYIWHTCANIFAYYSIYIANSLVGAITKIIGPSPLFIIVCAITCTIPGRRKESVFPLPV